MNRSEGMKTYRVRTLPIAVKKGKIWTAGVTVAGDPLERLSLAAGTSESDAMAQAIQAANGNGDWADPARFWAFLWSQGLDEDLVAQSLDTVDPFELTVPEGRGAPV